MEVGDYIFRVENLEELTTYFWRIDAINEQGTVTGKINEFKTLSANATIPDPNSSYRITGNGGILTAQYTSSKQTENYPNLIDVNTATKYFVGQNKLWVQYQSPTSEILSFYEVASANDTPTRDPKDWTLYGSNDGAVWDALDVQTNQSFNNRYERRFFVVNATTAYKYYKLDITANSGATQIQFSEWNLYRVNTMAIVTNSFKAHKTENGINLEWRANNIKPNTFFQVLRRNSSVGAFQIIKEVTASDMDYYVFNDKFPAIGTNYYRIRQVNSNYEFSDSDIVAIDYFNHNRLTVYSRDGKLFLTNELSSGNISISIFNIDGRKLFMQNFNNQGIRSEIPLKITLKPGVYISEINTDKEVISNKMIVY